MLAGITHEALFDVLVSLPPMAIKAVALRRRREAGEALERHELDTATVQLIDYGEACQKLIQRVQTLPAVPAADETLVAGYPL